ncbi:MAG: 2,3-bisphosphoglycerate-independent phosphoglycerate mutase [Rickettsiales bacterium]|jgi:2,3-bisphosphoglycerate-independent phosphoglycerate mutase|nr:2,3-bisphosphoglycerate-independent phosphoglycerate mutase [Rickettsiales bacterium]
MTKDTVVLCILDGFGISESTEHNAIYQADTPNWDRLIKQYPISRIDASGSSVGLPNGQMGNSEVGHLNIGAGRIVKQLLPLINSEIECGKVKDRPILQDFIRNTKAGNNICHLVGIISDGGVHGYMEHVLAFAEILAAANIQVYIHAILDGRDTAPESALDFLSVVQNRIKSQSNIKIASVTGRYYAMDRDNNWERVKLAYDNIIRGNVNQISDINAYIKESYANNITDEFIMPATISGFAGISDNDSIFFTNFRSDRARQIANALFQDDFTGFERSQKVNFATTLSMAEYSSDLTEILPCLFPVEMPKNTLSDVLADSGLRQLHIAETEKYAHVTFFFNGGAEAPKQGEDRILIPSPNVATFDMQPEMSAVKITEKLVEAINIGQYDFIVVNYANADMVGHTGNFSAAIKAVEVLDDLVARVSDAVIANNGNLIITADHGNIEQMYDQRQDQKHTAHTLNDVPCLLISQQDYNISNGKLCDLAPTILEIMHITQPDEMTGKSLIMENDTNS